jgi:hypothetical protein
LLEMSGFRVTSAIHDSYRRDFAPDFGPEGKISEYRRWLDERITCRTDMTHFRTLVAFLTAPLIIPVGLSLAAVVSPRDSPVSFTGFLGLLALFSLYALPTAYFIESLLGFPAWLLFRCHGIRSWSAFAMGGAALGTTYSVAYSVARYAAAKTMAYDFVRHSFTRDINPGPLWLAVPAGLASAILFRAIVFSRRFEASAKGTLSASDIGHYLSSAARRGQLGNTDTKG